MSRLLIGSLIIGILTFLLIYFVSPVIISESDTVAIFAEFALGLSNAYFDNMPPIIASYINHLNLAVAAVTVGLSLTALILLLVIMGGMCSRVARWTISWLHRNKKEPGPQDLPPIDMNSSFQSTGDGKEVLGRGLDSIDRK